MSNQQIMKVITYKKYGPPSVLNTEKRAKPFPKKNELLIKIHATTVTPSDILLRSGKFPLLFWLPTRAMFGFFNPRNKILGYEFSGVVEVIGSEVSSFKVGDHVCGATYLKMSCYAEYICLSEKSAIVLKPSNLSHIQAAAIPDGASTALHFLSNGGIQSGQKVLVYGASGSVGSYAIQFAKDFGSEVTGVCSSSNLDLVKSIGADYVIDYTRVDYSKSGEEFDIVFDAVGRTSFSQAKRVLKPDGIFLTVNFKLRTRFHGKWISLSSDRKLYTGFSTGNSEKLNRIMELVKEGKVKPIIDRTYPMDQIVRAHEYVGRGHKKGNVVIKTIHD